MAFSAIFNLKNLMKINFFIHLLYNLTLKYYIIVSIKTLGKN